MGEYIWGELVIDSYTNSFGNVVETVKECGERRERVVRCRDCKHGMGGGGLCALFSFPLGDGHIIPADVEPGGFCAWGEPREEG